jgi:hypothetical protein
MSAVFSQVPIKQTDETGTYRQLKRPAAHFDALSAQACIASVLTLKKALGLLPRLEGSLRSCKSELLRVRSTVVLERPQQLSLSAPQEIGQSLKSDASQSLIDLINESIEPEAGANNSKAGHFQVYACRLEPLASTTNEHSRRLSSPSSRASAGSSTSRAPLCVRRSTKSTRRCATVSKMAA